MIYVITATNSTLYQTITTKINGRYVRVYQNPTSKESLEDSFTIFAKAGDVVSVSGAKSYTLYVFVRNITT